MYNCLRFCQRLINPFTVEGVNQIIRHNGRIYSNKQIIPRYFNTVNSVFEKDGIVIKERGLSVRVSNLNDLVSYISNYRRIPVKQISQLFTTIKDDNLTEEQVLVLLECCSNSILIDNIMNKHDLCQTVLKKFELAGNFSEKVYESYIIICTENKQCLDVKSLISSLGNNITYNLLKLLLRNVCEYGDDVKALQVLSEMKIRGYPVDEEIFNYLILAHTIKGGLSSGLEVLQTMNRANLKESDDTLFFLIKGLIQRDNLKEFTDALDRYKITYSEFMTLSLLDAMGFKGNHTWAKFLTKYVNRSLLSRSFAKEVEKICTDLIHNEKYDAAFEIYKVFVEVDLAGTYGNCILSEMLFSSAPLDKILEFAKELKESGANEYALETVTGTALKNKLFKPALNFFRHLDTLKPHYFWPLLIEAHEESGELGLLDVLHTAQHMNVKFDFETFKKFIFPRCNLKNPKRVLNLFQEVGYTVRELLSPMIVVLLQKKEVIVAIGLCDIHKDVKLNPEEILKVLSITWLSTIAHKPCVTMLQKISESDNKEYVGQFLTDVLIKMNNEYRLKPFVDLLRELKTQNLMISSGTADTLLTIIKENLSSYDKTLDINGAIDDLTDFSKHSTEHTFVHPRDMTVDQLEVHLIELKSKGMETRGILRKLIQKYAGQGQSQRIRELRKELAAKGYTSSPGMKSSILHSHVQEGDLEEALKIYEELMQVMPAFKMDSFKIVDLARLLVERDQFDKAMEILKRSGTQSEVMEPARCWERNCINLLKCIRDMDLQQKMFNTLVDCGYCEPTNIILGTIVQLHLEKDTLENTVNLYVDCSRKYNKTPMQVVLLAKVLETGNNELLQKVLDGATHVHGQVAARSALVAAMCEIGSVNQVVTVLQETKFYPPKDVQKRCERWIQLDNMTALQTLLAASKKLPVKLLDNSVIQLAIMQLYSKRNDCDGALKFWKSLVDEEDHVDTKVDDEFCDLLNRCKFSSPENLTQKYKID